MLHIRSSIKMAQNVLECLDMYFLHWVVQKALAMCKCTSASERRVLGRHIYNVAVTFS